MLSYLAIGVAAAINLFNPQVAFVSSRVLEFCPAANEIFNSELAARQLPDTPGAMHCACVPRRGCIVGSVAGMIQHLIDSLRAGGWTILPGFGLIKGILNFIQNKHLHRINDFQNSALVFVNKVY